MLLLLEKRFYLPALKTAQVRPAHDRRVEREAVDPGLLTSFNPRGSIYSTIMDLGPKGPSPVWFW